MKPAVHHRKAVTDGLGEAFEMDTRRRIPLVQTDTVECNDHCDATMILTF